jgi:hypothetical protein
LIGEIRPKWKALSKLRRTVEVLAILGLDRDESNELILGSEFVLQGGILNFCTSPPSLAAIEAAIPTE